MSGINLYYSEIISGKINISSIISTWHCYFFSTQSNLSKASDLLMDCHGTFTIKVISMIKIGFQCYRCLSYQMTAQAFIRKMFERALHYKTYCAQGKPRNCKIISKCKVMSKIRPDISLFRSNGGSCYQGLILSRLWTKTYLTFDLNERVHSPLFLFVEKINFSYESRDIPVQRHWGY